MTSLGKKCFKMLDGYFPMMDNFDGLPATLPRKPDFKAIKKPFKRKV